MSRVSASGTASRIKALYRSRLAVSDVPSAIVQDLSCAFGATLNLRVGEERRR